MARTERYAGTRRNLSAMGASQRRAAEVFPARPLAFGRLAEADGRSPRLAGVLHSDPGGDGERFRYSRLSARTGLGRRGIRPVGPAQPAAGNEKSPAALAGVWGLRREIA